ncbi:hypothetical protein HELRODRAFT_79936, partial [Helobdella robusta]|uniref:cardiolipin synthase (CMP-forming) n=1 Tax=Helobdella robusta TaxID=6412 RepID=T1G3V2_HELRO
VLTVPNILTSVRIILTPFLCYLVLQGSYNAALSIFIFAGFTDLLDGLIARSFQSQTSDLGSFLDPLADKLLVSTLFLSLSYVDLIPAYLALLVITRDTLLTASGVYIRYITLNPKPRTLKEYFDPTNRSVKLQPTTLSKFNTAVQLTLVAATLASPVFNFTDHPYMHYLWYLTAFTTITSGIGYIFAKDTFKFVDKSYKKK